MFVVYIRGQLGHVGGSGVSRVPYQHQIVIMLYFNLHSLAVEDVNIMVDVREWTSVVKIYHI